MGIPLSELPSVLTCKEKLLVKGNLVKTVVKRCSESENILKLPENSLYGKEGLPNESDRDSSENFRSVLYVHK